MAFINQYELNQVREAASNRWREILPAIANIDAHLLDGNPHPCPNGCHPNNGGKDRFRFIHEADGACYCNQCQNSKNGDGIAAVQWLLKTDFKTALTKVGDYLGLKPTKKKKSAEDPAKYLEFVEWNQGLAKLWCSKQEPITIEALEKVGARQAMYRKSTRVIAIPVHGLDPDKAIGWTIYNITGGPINRKAGNKIEQVKVKLTYGSRPGIMGKIDPASTEIWKTEGPKDLLALLSLELPPGVSVICNANGAKEDPARNFQWLREQVKGKKIFVVHDCDEPGQEGATFVPRNDGSQRPGWAPFLAGTPEEPNEVRNIVLPYPIAPTSGKDLRDFIVEKSGDYDQLVHISKFEDLVKPVEESAESDLDEFEDDPHRLARVNLSKYKQNHDGRLVFWREEFWKYKDGCYRPITRAELKAKLTDQIRQEFERSYRERVKNQTEEKILPVKKVTVGLVNNVIQALESLTTVSGSVDMPSWLPDRSRRNFLAVKNGMLDLDALFAGKGSEDCLLDHSPEWFSPIRLDYNFDESAECPEFEKYIRFLTSGNPEKIDLLQEWAGYLLWPIADRQRFLVFEGEGGTGKSSFFAAMTAMVGDENVSSVSLEDFGERFALASTIGKVANIAGDVGKITNNEEAILKRYTGGDKMEMRRMYVSPIHVRPTAKLMMAWNERPRFKDKSSGLWRRMLLLPLNNQVPASGRVFGMDDWKFWKDERSGILLWALEGLARLIENGDFTKCEEAEAALKEYQDETNPTKIFVRDCLIEDEEKFCEVDDVYSLYREWCEMAGIHPLSKMNFGREIKRAAPLLRKGRRQINNFRVYTYEKISYNSGINFLGDRQSYLLPPIS